MKKERKNKEVKADKNAGNYINLTTPPDLLNHQQFNTTFGNIAIINYLINQWKNATIVNQTTRAKVL